MSNENIYSCSYPLLWFLKVLGIFVPSFDQHGKFKIRIIDKIYFVFANFMILTLFGFNLMKQQNEMSSSPLVAIAWESCAFFGNISSVIMMMYQYRNSKYLIQILKVLNDFDNKVEYFSIILTYQF